jgi:hypothetical protein
VSVFMYGHNGRHFRLAALLKRPAGRLGALCKSRGKSRFKDRGGCADPPIEAPRGARARDRAHRGFWYLYSRFKGWFCSCVCLPVR